MSVLALRIHSCKSTASQQCRCDRDFLHKYSWQCPCACKDIALGMSAGMPMPCTHHDSRLNEGSPMHPFSKLAHALYGLAYLSDELTCLCSSSYTLRLISRTFPMSCATRLVDTGTLPCRARASGSLRVSSTCVQGKCTSSDGFFLGGPQGAHRGPQGAHRVAHRVPTGAHRVAHRVPTGCLGCNTPKPESSFHPASTCSARAPEHLGSLASTQCSRKGPCHAVHKICVREHLLQLFTNDHSFIQKED